jgi:hypothetical protein
MNKRRAAASALALVLGLTFAARSTALPVDTARREVELLLAAIEYSGCEFFRNGSWYGGAQARLHLRQKYDYLVARNQVASAEQFIDEVATKSSFSGQPYRVRCSQGIEVPSQQWMREQLARIRVSR